MEDYLYSLTITVVNWEEGWPVPGRARVWTALKLAGFHAEAPVIVRDHDTEDRTLVVEARGKHTDAQQLRDLAARFRYELLRLCGITDAPAVYVGINGTYHTLRPLRPCVADATDSWYLDRAS